MRVPVPALPALVALPAAGQERARHCIAIAGTAPRDTFKIEVSLRILPERPTVVVQRPFFRQPR